MFTLASPGICGSSHRKCWPGPPTPVRIAPSLICLLPMMTVLRCSLQARGSGQRRAGAWASDREFGSRLLLLAPGDFRAHKRQQLPAVVDGVVIRVVAADEQRGHPDVHVIEQGLRDHLWGPDEGG